MGKSNYINMEKGRVMVIDRNMDKDRGMDMKTDMSINRTPGISMNKLPCLFINIKTKNINKNIYSLN